MRVTQTTTVSLAATGSATARLHARLSTFQPAWRKRIYDLVEQRPALEDLAESHPALLFAFVSGFGDETSRRLAIDSIERGVPLEMAASLFGLPRWLRKLPAAALSDPFPRFEQDNDFSRRMANLVPQDRLQTAAWLRAVGEAQIAGGRSYALWFARHGVALTGTLSETRRQLLHAWVWMGQHPGESAHALIRRPWSPDCGIKRVMDEFIAWLHRIALAEWLGTGHLIPWVPDAEVHGYQFHTLRSADEFVRAAEALDNCLEQYADRLRLGSSVVVLISQDDVPVACLELEPHDAELRLPAIKQLRGCNNRRVPAAVWQAVYAWLGRSPLTPLPHPASEAHKADRACMRGRLWNAYLEALGIAEGGEPFERRARQALSEIGTTWSLTSTWPRFRLPDGWRQMEHDLETRASLMRRLIQLLPRAAGRE